MLHNKKTNIPMTCKNKHLFFSFRNYSLAVLHMVFLRLGCAKLSQAGLQVLGWVQICSTCILYFGTSTCTWHICDLLLADDGSMDDQVETFCPLRLWLRIGILSLLPTFYWLKQVTPPTLISI